MNDCPNADIRDRLPDLVHEHLDADARMRVIAHLETCADCRAELEVLRGVRRVLERATHVDVARIIAALPAPAAARPPRIRRAAAWHHIDWRIAAAVVAMAAGSASVGTYLHITTPGAVVESIGSMSAHQHPGLDTAVPSNAAVASAASAAGASVTELATGDGLTDMSAQQLRALLDDIEHFQALPSPDPDTTMVTGPAVGYPGGL